MNSNTKYARRIDDYGEIRYQTLIDHIQGVSKYTEEFVQKFFVKNTGKILGYLHDLGKYSEEFQKRIRGENIKVDHSTAGAVVCDEIERDFISNKNKEYIVYKILKYCIVGHHSGLMNHGNQFDIDSTLVSRLKKRHDQLCDFSDWKKEIDIEELKKIIITKNEIRYFNSNFSIQMLIRFLFSSLVDGDRLDAQTFSEGEKNINCEHINLSSMLDIFNEYMNEKRKNNNGKIINEIRNSIFKQCEGKSINSRGFFSLCVPTGGGKTLSSLAFALNHAKINGHERIVYSLPFTSIIEQNAKVYSDIFGEDNVLEHHCNFNFKDFINENDYSEKQIKYKLLTENWNIPLIVTTNVQLFESMYSNKPSSARKLHNLYNSIIILDEAQVIPNEYLKPCMMALEELVRNYNCTVLFCTATQPEFQKNGLLSNEFTITEIIDDTRELFNNLKRVEYEFIGVKSTEEICSKIDSLNQVLVIVNTKKHARDIFSKLSKSDGTFHLSTNMYPNHRKEIISEIRERLNSGKECKVISTQLIEAGVDVDFPVVFRSIAGVDSIVQAAGRCNREGLRPNSFVYVFKPEDPIYLGMGYLKTTAQIGEYILDKFNSLSIDSISAYFDELFNNTKYTHDEHGIIDLINKYKNHETNYDFKEIIDRFKFINNVGIQIIIPIGEACNIIKRLKFANKGAGKILRKLNGYSINVPEFVFKDLVKNNFIHEEIEGIYVLDNLCMYDNKLGFDKDSLGNYEYVI